MARARKATTARNKRKQAADVPEGAPRKREKAAARTGRGRAPESTKANERLRAEIKKLRRAERRHERRLAFERLLAAISARFISLPGHQLDNEIRSSQQIVCECLGIDMSTLWQLSKDHPGSLLLTHIYSPPGFPPLPQRMEAKDSFPWAQEKMFKGESIAISRLTDAPAAARRDLELWRHYGLKSFLTIPLSAGGGAVFGALNFSTTREEREWPLELVNRLQLVAQIFAGALARKIAEDALRESEARLSLAADSADAGLWSWDFKTGQIWATGKAREIHGFAPNEKITPDGFLRTIHPPDRGRVDRAVRQAFREGAEFRSEHRIIVPDNRVRWIVVRARAFVTPSGEPDRMMGVSLDVSQRKQDESERLQLHLEVAHIARVMTMSELSASLAHEINQPLGAILNNATAAKVVLAQATDRREEIGEIVADIIKDARRAGDVVRKIRGIVKKGDVRFEQLDMNALIADVAELFQNSIAINGVSLHLDLQPGLAEVRGELVHLQQVLLNVITNALEAMKESSSRILTIRSRMQAPDTVTVSVGDSGTGIDGAGKDNLFEPFFTTKKEGLGMGLAICRSIVEKHGGRIWAENNPAGGATFSFSLHAWKGEPA